MPKLTSAQARELSRSFRGMAQAIGDYIFDNWNNLTGSQRTKLTNFEDSLRSSGADMLALSTTLILEEVESSLTIISEITTEIKEDYKKLARFQDAIKLAANMVTLGAAVISKSPESIGKAFNDLRKSWDKVKDA
ncbi:MAG: hypothetical protein ACR2MM_08510 [Flavobacteriaceae bacterium]